MTELSEFVRRTRDDERGVALGMERDGETWLRAERSGSLMIGFRLAPGEDRRWELVETATLPSKGERLTPEAIRRVPLGTLAREAQDEIARTMAKREHRRATRTAHKSSESKPLLSGPTEANLSAFLRGARGMRIADADYALLAFEYVQLAEAGNRSPAKHLSDTFGHGSPAQWSNRIGEARKRGLLSEAARGTVGGHLTEKAEALVGLA